jgi:hypothetical protein
MRGLGEEKLRGGDLGVKCRLCTTPRYLRVSESECRETHYWWNVYPFALLAVWAYHVCADLFSWLTFLRLLFLRLQSHVSIPRTTSTCRVLSKERLSITTWTSVRRLRDL